MFYLAWRNITRRLGSSALTAFIAFMAVLALTASMIVVTSLEDGVRLSRERLGADVMVLPAGASGNASEVLFCAEPVNVYLPASAVEAVAATEGVAASTPQFFTPDGGPELLLGGRGHACGGHRRGDGFCAGALDCRRRERSRGCWCFGRG